MGFDLRDYQNEAILTVAGGISNGEKRQLVSLPTGTGKTVVFSNFIEHVSEELGMKRTLVLAHRDELISQAVAKIKKQLPEANIGVVKGNKNEIGGQIIVASIQTIGRKKRMEQFPEDYFDLIVIDEAHHAYSPSYMKVMGYFGAFRKDIPTYVVGFTATAQRPGLDRIFNLAYHKDIREMIKKGYLAPVNAIQVETAISLTVGTRAGDFDTAELSKEVNTPERNMLTVEKYIELAYGEKAIAFTADVQHAIDLSKTFNQMGIKARYVHAGTPSHIRQEILEGQQNGDIKIICNCGILTEGYDDPSISTVLMARPTLSSTLYIQMVGRGLRLHPEKEECKVIDLVDNCDRHDLITLPFLLPDFKGMKKKSKKRNTGTDVDENTGEEVETAELPDHELHTAESEVDLFTVNANLEWEEQGNDLVYNAANTTVAVVESGGWYFIDVARIMKKDGKKVVKNKRLNKVPYTNQDSAREVAEVYITKMGFTGSTKNKREHRNNPNCQELLDLVTKIDYHNVLTEKESQLMEVFLSEGDVQINRTAKLIGTSHTNVWIRLYGNKKGEIGGILKKMREANIEVAV